MTASGQDILIGIDAGTSVVKSVAFTLDGLQIAVASTPNRYVTGANGAAYQSQDDIWADCAKTLRSLSNKVPRLAKRTAAISVTGQGGWHMAGWGRQSACDRWLALA